jgi:hypothetical protein
MGLLLPQHTAHTVGDILRSPLRLTVCRGTQQTPIHSTYPVLMKFCSVLPGPSSAGIRCIPEILRAGMDIGLKQAAPSQDLERQCSIAPAICRWAAQGEAVSRFPHSLPSCSQQQLRGGVRTCPSLVFPAGSCTLKYYTINFSCTS